ncbi:DUF4276 family protein [Planktothrix agardhii 1806]|uniref:DUF4276 family protein n=1 Tax=Planktothrix agardhii TaxID=1160 RepID=UPI001F3C176A|nr:DUF4276 family protein [Planktothrix agardhii]MCF3603498.1 DUF4276 family protein [Planktothrix agardhii 1804]MCF3615595.1 DUF4276 family protein [Planktothrix agardhii 1806]MEA5563603.1 DUF4276 family protein [Planktothrix agardhii UHCC 0887]
MVVWVFAGGGEAEVRGLIPFLTQNFPGCQFQRKTPVRRKPGPKPNPLMSYGRTGKSLIEQIQEQLPIALKAERNQCDLIFVFDDLDCRNPETQRQDKLSEALIQSSIQDETDRHKPRFYKGIDTPILLLKIDPSQVQKKCPLFRQMYNYLQNFCFSFPSST